jgi:hypothetical protein
MTHLQVFDPPMCCSSGVCGPSIDPKLPRFARDLDWLRSQGVQVERYNLAHQPQAFIAQEDVKTAIRADQKHALPLVRVNGHMSVGYTVEDHSKGHPYDLLCTRKKERLHVEVKGTQTNGAGVFLTFGEVQFARDNKQEMALFLLRSIQVSGDGKTLSNGQERVIVPWDVDEGELKPLSFRYSVPEEKTPR